MIAEYELCHAEARRSSVVAVSLSRSSTGRYRYRSLGSSEATAYVLENPCITGWQVPWTVPLTVLHSMGLMGAIAAVVIAFALRGSKTRAIAVVCLLAGVVLWLYAANLISAPYGWHCDRP